MKRAVVLILFLAVVVGACAVAEEVPPTKTPKPTWTLPPQGTFLGCVYYQDELVEGSFQFYKDEELVKTADSYQKECVETTLLPGRYWVIVSYWKGSDCSGSSGCGTKDEIFIEIAADQVIEMDFDVFPP